MALIFIDHVNDLISTFMSAMFIESNRRSGQKQSMLEDFRDLMESAVLNNGALSDADISSLQLYTEETPAPDRHSWGAWGKHFSTYEATFATDFEQGVQDVIRQWLRIGTEEPFTSAQVVAIQPGPCLLVLFQCLQHVVHNVIFTSPWLYMHPSDHSIYDQLEVLDNVRNQIEIALINAYIHVHKPELATAVVAELQRVFNEDVPVQETQWLQSESLQSSAEPLGSNFDSDSDSEAASKTESDEKVVTTKVLQLSDYAHAGSGSSNLSDCAHVDPMLTMRDCLA